MTLLCITVVAQAPDPANVDEKCVDLLYGGSGMAE
jgi:hypothetical protein